MSELSGVSISEPRIPLQFSARELLHHSLVNHEPLRAGGIVTSKIPLVLYLGEKMPFPIVYSLLSPGLVQAVYPNFDQAGSVTTLFQVKSAKPFVAGRDVEATETQEVIPVGEDNFQISSTQAIVDARTFKHIPYLQVENKGKNQIRYNLPVSDSEPRPWQPRALEQGRYDILIGDECAMTIDCDTQGFKVLHGKEEIRGTHDQLAGNGLFTFGKPDGQSDPDFKLDSRYASRRQGFLLPKAGGSVYFVNCGTNPSTIEAQK